MGSTVFANTLAVATSTSGHFGATIVDVRLVDKKVPTPLLNYIASEHIARNFPATVRFDKGKVWNEPTEVGDPPKSLPADTFPTPKGAINSYAMGAAGAGSGNVFVGGKKVLCHTHTTEQNAKNSKGKIVNWAELQKLIAEAEENEKKRKAKADADAKSKSQGTGTGAGGKPTVVAPPPKPPPVVPAAPEGCAVSGVKLLESGRKPANAAYTAPDTYIEVMNGANVELEAASLGTKMCEAHPVWNGSNGWTEKGPKAKFPAGISASMEATGGGVKTLMAAIALANVRSIDYGVTLTDHKGIAFRRTIKVLPKIQLTPLKVDVGEWGNTLSDKLTGGFNKCPIKVIWSIRPVKLELAIECKWDAMFAGTANEHKCYYKAAIKGVGTAFDAIAEANYSLLGLPIPAPPVVAVLRAIQGLNWIGMHIPGFNRNVADIKVFLRIQGTISLSAGIEFQKLYEAPFSLLPAACGEIKGEITGSLGLRIEALSDGKAGGSSLAKGEAYAQLKLEVVGTLISGWPPGYAVTGKLNQPTLNLELSYDLTVLLPSPAAGTSLWARFKNNVRDGLFEMIGGEESLKGSQKYTVGFGWDDKPLFDDIIRIPNM